MASEKCFRPPCRRTFHCYARKFGLHSRYETSPARRLLADRNAHHARADGDHVGDALWFWFGQPPAFAEKTVRGQPAKNLSRHADLRERLQRFAEIGRAS